MFGQRDRCQSESRPRFPNLGRTSPFRKAIRHPRAMLDASHACHASVPQLPGDPQVCRRDRQGDIALIHSGAHTLLRRK